jgi:photosystem II stability/assembly factor-like uncharacterized protein
MQWMKQVSPRATVVLLVLVLTIPVAHERAKAQIDWVLLDRPTHRDLVKMSFLDSLRGWVAGDSGVILRTSDGGTTWIQQTTPVEFNVVDIDMVDDRYGWAVAQQYPNDTTSEYGTSVLNTTDGGETWNIQTTFDQFLHTVEFIDSVNGCLGGELGKLFWTTDGGVDWISAVVDSPVFARWPIRRIDYYSPSFVIAVGGQYDVTGLIWRSTDGGRLWTHRRVAGEPIFGSYFHDSLNITCVGGDFDFGAGLVRSTNGGVDWQYTFLGIWGQGTAVSFRTPYEGWAPLGFAGTYMYSLDSGNTWTSMFTPDSTGMLDVVFTDSLTGYMVGAEGTILKYSGPTTAIPEDGPGVLPAEAQLLQNYPNPFNPKTEITYRLSTLSNVEISVFDLLGRQVATLVDGVKPPGTYLVTWEATGMASGVYYYRMTAGDFVQAKKLLLLR